MITLPGLIDPHVHFRTPGQSYKEDFISGTKAAIAGGFTTVLDMPNNKLPITSHQLLIEKKKLAKEKILCDIGFYFGSLGDNLDELAKVRKDVFGLKLYLNQTTGNFIIDKKNLLSIYDAWDKNLPILVHAEEDVIDLVIKVCKQTKKRTHICHVSTVDELKTVIAAKKKGLPITCGVTPHHLFLTEEDVKKLKSFGMVKPTLKTHKDVNFIWKNLKWIDVIESDHAPHTIAEKRSENPPFGVPGLETTLGLLLTACSQGKLTINDIIRLCHTGPKQCFDVLIHHNTRIIVDENEEWIVRGSQLFTKCKWSPFEGRTLKGKVKKVYIRNKLVFEDNKFLVKPGFAHVLSP